MSGPASRGPGAEHAAPAMACTMITGTGTAARTANARAAGQHGRDASRASSLPWAPSVQFAGAT
jgi:hypothetical protein